MAKVTLRNGVTAVAKWRVTRKGFSHISGTEVTDTYLFVVRSDGKVLRRLTGEYQSGYTVIGKFTNSLTIEDPSKLVAKTEAYLGRRFDTIEKIG